MNEYYIENNFCKALEDQGFREYKGAKTLEALEKFTRSELENLNLRKGNFEDQEWKEIKRWIFSFNKTDKHPLKIILNDHYNIKRDNEDIKIHLIKQTNDLYKRVFCQNSFSYIKQLSFKDSRADVILMINGIPICLVELKRVGIPLFSSAGAFEQVKTYKNKFGISILNYIQFFVISNNSNTSYFASSKQLDKVFCFKWTDTNNKKIENLNEFTKSFFDIDNFYKMITLYTIINIEYEILILRPYQIYAVEAIIKRVYKFKDLKELKKENNGYIWHTTGSGKTLTSFKTAQILRAMPEIDKIIFIVDRNDLDNQTRDEFNNFEKDCVDDTNNTKKLKEQLLKSSDKLIITTIHKLNKLLTSKDIKEIKHLQDKRVILIFDECHRSQFGNFNKNIQEFFKRAQLFGFTGTPIKEENARNKSGIYLTEHIFNNLLHKYTIKNAINDKNVLGFSRDYADVEIDNSLNLIKNKFYYEDDKRIEKISEFVLNIHHKKTSNKTYTAIFASSSIKANIKYYLKMKEIIKNTNNKNIQNIKIASIFSTNKNQQQEDIENGLLEELGEIKEESAFEKLSSFVDDYNKTFNCSQSIENSIAFNTYRNDISKRVKNKEIDILIVTTMFLTGFDSKYLNTIYLDKDLEYHGLIQAISRTNRICDIKKEFGQVVLFRDLRSNFDNAIKLFSNEEDSNKTIFAPEYKELESNLKSAVSNFLEKFPSISSVKDLEGNLAKIEFIESFKEVLKKKNVIKPYIDYKDKILEDLGLPIEVLEEFQGYYYEVYSEIKNNKKAIKEMEKDPDENNEKLAQCEFNIELIDRAIIDVDYILLLLCKSNEDEYSKYLTRFCQGANESQELVSNFIKINTKCEDEKILRIAFEKFKKECFNKELDKLFKKYPVKKEAMKKAIEKYTYRNDENKKFSESDLNHRGNFLKEAVRDERIEFEEKIDELLDIYQFNNGEKDE